MAKCGRRGQLGKVGLNVEGVAKLGAADCTEVPRRALHCALRVGHTSSLFPYIL